MMNNRPNNISIPEQQEVPNILTVEQNDTASIPTAEQNISNAPIEAVNQQEFGVSYPSSVVQDRMKLGKNELFEYFPNPLQNNQQVQIADKLIEEADSIARDLANINKTILNDALLKEQFNLYKAGQLKSISKQPVDHLTNSPTTNEKTYDAEPVFDELMTRLTKLAGRYDAIKTAALDAQLVSPEYLHNIESSAVDANKNFHPLYENTFTTAKKDTDNKYKPSIHAKLKQLAEIEKAYNKRATFHRGFEVGTGLLSIFTPFALPFLGVSLLAHTLDMLVTKIREHKLKNEITKNQENIQTEYNAAKTGLENRIKGSDCFTRFNQGFFKLSQASQTGAGVDISANIANNLPKPPAR